MQPGDIVRTAKPINGWFHGGYILSIDELTGYVAIQSGDTQKVFHKQQLIKSDNLATKMSEFQKEFDKMLTNGTYATSSDGYVQMPLHMLEIMHELSSLIKFPMGTPMSKPLKVRLDDPDIADWWKNE